MIRVTIPAYNEEGVIRDLLEGLDEVLADRPEAYRVLVVDDGSTDATGAIVEECATRLPVDLIRHETNRNLGGAMRTGLHATAAAAAPDDVVITMDADNTHPPDRIPDLLAAIEKGADAVIASRYVPGGGVVGVPWYRNVLSLGANGLFRRLFPIPGVREYTGSYRAIKARVLQTAIAAWGEAFIGEDGFTCMPEILIHLRGFGFRFSEIPLVIRYDMKVGASKMRVARNIFGSFALMKRLLRHRVPPRTDRIAVVSVPWVATPPRGIGSIGHISHELARRLARHRELMLIGGTYDLDEPAVVAGIDYVRIGDGADRWLIEKPIKLLARWLPGGRQRPYMYRSIYHRWYARRAARALRRFRPAVVLVQFFPQWLPVLEKRLPGSRFLLGMQAETLTSGPETLRRPLAFAHRIISCGAHLTRLTRERLPHLADRCRTIYNGFDPELFAPVEEGVGAGSAAAGAARSGRPEILYVGRITPEKGVHLLVRAVARLVAEGRDLSLTLAGPVRTTDPKILTCLAPELRAELESLGGRYRSVLEEEAGAALERVSFLGARPQRELAGLYRRASIFVHPTLWEEPFGMPVVEAMACGTPVVAGRAGAMPEIIEEGTTGLLYEPGRDVELADCLRRLLDDPELARRLGEAGRRRARDRFSWDRSVEELERLIDELLGAPPSGAGQRASRATLAPREA